MFTLNQFTLRDGKILIVSGYDYSYGIVDKEEEDEKLTSDNATEFVRFLSTGRGSTWALHKRFSQLFPDFVPKPSAAAPTERDDQPDGFASYSN